jgi:hypothetical protein
MTRRRGGPTPETCQPPYLIHQWRRAGPAVPPPNCSRRFRARWFMTTSTAVITARTTTTPRSHTYVRVGVTAYTATANQPPAAEILDEFQDGATRPLSQALRRRAAARRRFSRPSFPSSPQGQERLRP